MDSYFKCYRCNNYKTDRKCNMVTHLIKKFKCSKHPDVVHLSDMELYNKSILRINEIPENLYNQNHISLNICKKCNKIFSTKYYTNRHFLKCKNL